jgi:hypothetical protein
MRGESDVSGKGINTYQMKTKTVAYSYQVIPRQAEGHLANVPQGCHAISHQDLGYVRNLICEAWCIPKWLK